MTVSASGTETATGSTGPAAAREPESRAGRCTHRARARRLRGRSGVGCGMVRGAKVKYTQRAPRPATRPRSATRDAASRPAPAPGTRAAGAPRPQAHSDQVRQGLCLPHARPAGRPRRHRDPGNGGCTPVSAEAPSSRRWTAQHGAGQEERREPAPPPALASAPAPRALRPRGPLSPDAPVCGTAALRARPPPAHCDGAAPASTQLPASSQAASLKQIA